MEEITFEELIELVHAIFCFKDHPKKCKFEVEEQQVEAMDLPEHKYWSDFTTTLYKACGAESLTDMLDKLTEATAIISDLSTRTATIINIYITSALESDSDSAFKDHFFIRCKEVEESTQSQSLNLDHFADDVDML